MKNVIKIVLLVVILFSSVEAGWKTKAGIVGVYIAKKKMAKNSENYIEKLVKNHKVRESKTFRSKVVKTKFKTTTDKNSDYGLVRIEKRPGKKDMKYYERPRIVYQRKDIDLDYKFKGKSNLERMNGGSSLHISNNGKDEVIVLHHSKQNAKGSLFELKASTHTIANKDKGAKALHPYKTVKKGGKHPNNPVTKDERELFFEKEKKAYYSESRNKGDDSIISQVGTGLLGVIGFLKDEGLLNVSVNGKKF